MRPNNMQQRGGFNSNRGRGNGMRGGQGQGQYEQRNMMSMNGQFRPQGNNQKYKTV